MHSKTPPNPALAAPLHAAASSHRSLPPLSPSPPGPVPQQLPRSCSDQPRPSAAAFSLSPHCHLWARAFPPRRPAADASCWCRSPTRWRQHHPRLTADPRWATAPARSSTRHMARHPASTNGSAQPHRRHRIAPSPHRGAACPGGET